MRLLLVGAFRFPHAQGSQVYFREQARALRDAGAEVELLSYGPGDAASAGAGAGAGADTNTSGTRDAATAWTMHAPPAWTTPRSARSGPRLAKPVADAALVWRLRRLLAGRSPARRFDAVLAHHAEAAAAAWLATRGRPEPVVYCQHTLLGEELSSYPGLGHAVVDAVGARIDRALARRVDGWIALSERAAEVLGDASKRPGLRLGPPLADPRLEDPDPATTGDPPPPTDAYFLYSGNADPYQELESLFAAGARLAARAGAPRIVVASHDAHAGRRFEGRPGLDFVPLGSARAMRRWIGGALALLVPRRRPGGFPIKLLNGLAAGVPALTWHDAEWGLRHGVDVWCVRREVPDGTDPAAAFAAGVERLCADEAACLRLGRGARARYEAAHRPEQVAPPTLALVERLRSAALGPRAVRLPGATTPDGAEAPLSR